MRKYQPIWEQVKKHRKAKIIAPPNLHKRIIQAVRKEKAMDYAFRNLAKKKRVKVLLKDISDKERGIVDFYLEITEGIKVEDL